MCVLLLIHRGHYFGCEVVLPFFNSFAELITCESTNTDIFTDLRDHFGDHLLYRFVRIFNEFLFQ